MKMLACGLLALALCAASPAVRAAGPDYAGMTVQPFDPPKAAPGFSLPTLDGKTVRLEDFKGKVVMLVFWTSW
jgi:cytochrome oxidase Cu insertion factor (SCO1/SenC/PrrC family)